MLYHAKIEDCTFGHIRGEVDGNNYMVRLNELTVRQNDASLFLLMNVQNWTNLKDFKNESFNGENFLAIMEIHKTEYTKFTWNKATSKYDAAQQQPTMLEKAVIAVLGDLEGTYQGVLSLADNPSHLDFVLKNKDYHSLIFDKSEKLDTSTFSDTEINKAIEAITKRKSSNGGSKKSVAEMAQERFELVKKYLPTYTQDATNLEGVMAALACLKQDVPDEAVFNATINILSILIK